MLRVRAEGVFRDVGGLFVEEAVGEDPTVLGFRCCSQLWVQVLSVVIWEVVVSEVWGGGQCLFWLDLWIL